MTTLPPDDSALSEVIDECLEALRRGESIDDCLSRHPDIADELRPLLIAAVAMANVAPTRDESARRIAHTRFEGAVRHHLATNPRATSGRFSIRDWWNIRASRWTRVWAVGFATMAMFVVLSTGAAYASNDALPDSPLYPVKRATEHARLAITFSDDSRAIYHLELIERRTLELAAVAESGDQTRAEELSRDVLKNIEFARVEAGYTGADVAQQEEALDTAAQSQLTGEAIEPSITLAPDDSTASSDAVSEIVQVRVDPRLRAYIEAERESAARAYAALQIAHQVAPPHMRPHVLNALTLAEQRYRTTRYPGEPAPISRTLFAQGIARITDQGMTISGRLPFEISHNALGNRPPRDGDIVTVGGYVRDDGVLLVLRLYVFEAEGIAEDQIWLQSEAIGRNEGVLFIPGFNVSVDDWSQVGNPAANQGSWVYVEGTVRDYGEVDGEDIHLLGAGPILFPQP